QGGEEAGVEGGNGEWGTTELQGRQAHRAPRPWIPPCPVVTVPAQLRSLFPIPASTSASPLAVPAPNSGALADRGLFQRPPAGRAGFAAAAVGAQFLIEVARRAVRGEEVAQRGAAAGDGVFEDPPHGVGEQPV